MDTTRFQQAVALRDSGRVEEALREFASLTKSTADPEDKASLLANEATCLTILGRLRDGKERLSDARRIAPRTQALLYLDFGDASLLTHEGKWDKALQNLDRLQREHRDLLLTAQHRSLYKQIQIVRGTALLAVTRYREARDVLEECLSFHLGADDERHVLYNLGACYANLGENERAKHALAESLRTGMQGSDAVSAHYYLGKIYFAEKAYAKALKEFEACLPDIEQAQIPRGHLFEWLASTARAAGKVADGQRYETLAKGQ